MLLREGRAGNQSWKDNIVVFLTGTSQWIVNLIVLRVEKQLFLCCFQDIVWLLCRWSRLWARCGTQSTLCAQSARRSWAAATSSRRTGGLTASPTTSPCSLRTAPTATSPSLTWETETCREPPSTYASCHFNLPFVFSENGHGSG